MAFRRARAASSTLFSRLLHHSVNTNVTTSYRTISTNVTARKTPHPSSTSKSNHAEKWINSKFLATIGTIPSEPNPGNGEQQLYNAGQSQWLGQRPKVRGVAMNPIDHATRLDPSGEENRRLVWVTESNGTF
ncbi:hypothetical protein ACFX11_032329 [Malus domestica]